MANRKGELPSQQQHSRREIPDFQFRGVWTPPVVCEHLRRGRVSTTDQTLLMMIDAFSYGPRGCFATNKYLAEQIGKSVWSVKKSLATLRKLHLIVTEGERETRRMWVAWAKYTDGHQGKPFPDPQGKPFPDSEEASEEKLNSVPRPRDADPTPQTPCAGVDTMRPDEVADGLLPVDMGSPPLNKRTVTPTPQTLEYADRLRRAVVEHTSFHSKYSARDWAREFGLLLQTLVGDTARLEKALEWLTANLTAQYTPVIRSAAAFRKKFPQLEAAVARDRRKHPDVAVGPDAHEVVKGLEHLAWPANVSESELPVVAQLSLDNILAFAAKLAARASDKRWQWSVRRVLDVLDPVDTAREWLTNVCHRLHRWSRWDGTLAEWAWRPDRPECLVPLREWVDADEWESFLEDALGTSPDSRRG